MGAKVSESWSAVFTRSALLDRVCACSYENLPKAKHRSYCVGNTVPCFLPYSILLTYDMFTQHYNVGRRPYSSACGFNVKECQLNGQGVGEGECVVKEEIRDGRGGEGEGIRFGAQWTPAGTPAGGHQLGRSRHPLPCGSGQLYN